MGSYARPAPDLLSPPAMARTEVHIVTMVDLQEILGGKDGADLTSSAQGMQLIDVAPGSITERLGGRNGDVIETVNGATLDSLSKGYGEAYAAIKYRRIVVAGNRDGEPFVITLALPRR